MLVFLSYSRIHKFVAEVLKEMLEADGYSVWIDADGIQAGEIWKQTIREAIKQCFVMVVAVTTPALKSVPIADEIAIAKEYDKHIIPLIMEKFPSDTNALSVLELNDRQAINFAVQPKGVAQAELIVALRSAYAGWSLVRPYIRKLEDQDPKVRIEIAKQLGETNSKQATPYLIRMLEDLDISVVCEAALSLGKLQDQRAVEPLIRLIREHAAREFREETSIEDVRYNTGISLVIEDAALALGAIADRRGVPILISLLSMNVPSPRLSQELGGIVAQALGYLGDPSAINSLIQLLNEENSDVRYSAIIALGLIGGDEAVDSLISLVINEIAFTKTFDGTTYFSDDYVLDSDMGSALWDDLCQKYRVTEPLIVQYAFDRISVPGCTMIVLGLLGNERAVEPIMEFLELTFEDGEPETEGAALALGLLRSEKTIPFLESHLERYEVERPKHKYWGGLKKEYIQAALRMFAQDV